MKEGSSDAKEQIEKLHDLNSDSFKVFTAINLDDSLNCVEKRQDKEYTNCPAAYLRTLICPSGVFVCPYWRGKEPFRIGDATRQSMKEIWTSERRAEVMRKLNPCTVCNFHCLRNETNIEVLRIKEHGFDHPIKEFDRFI